MWAVTTWPFFSFTRKVVLGRVSTTSPSIWIASSLDTRALNDFGGANWSTKAAAKAICAARASGERGRGLRDLLAQQALEGGARDRAGAETPEVARVELTVDHDDAVAQAQRHQMGEGHLG